MTTGLDGRIYVFGGVTNDFQTRNNLLQTLNVFPMSLIHIAAEKIASSSQFDDFVRKHTLNSPRLFLKYELCFQKLPY